ncbi:MAG: hypothetical protein HW414_314 [Dehalococcoidia bacterium]|nr:hypothetical protein [Dehalococcoidia bacterium]
MGTAIVVGLVTLVLVVAGFLVYGLGLAALRLLRFWEGAYRWLVTP